MVVTVLLALEDAQLRASVNIGELRRDGRKFCCTGGEGKVIGRGSQTYREAGNMLDTIGVKIVLVCKFQAN